jgi:hypothetical protein
MMACQYHADREAVGTYEGVPLCRQCFENNGGVIDYGA